MLHFVRYTREFGLGGGFNERLRVSREYGIKENSVNAIEGK